LDVLRRYEKSFSGENKDKVSNVRTYLDLIYSEFPLINESNINAIVEDLGGIEFPELEECAESIKDMQRKIIRLTCLEKEPLKDKTNEYIEKYRSNRANLTNVFDDEGIGKIPEIQEQKIVEVRNQIVRVRRILEIRYKYAKPRQKETIKSYITEIKNFETKAYFIHEDEERSELRSLLDVFEGISELSGLNFVIGPIIKILKAIFALDKLRDDYIREKEEYSNYDSQDPIDALHRRYLNVDIRTEQARNRYIVELAELIIRKHGPMTVIELGNCFDWYHRNDREFSLSRIRKDQIQNAVYSSNRFRVVNKRPLIGTGKRKYNVYDVRRRWR